MEKKICSKCKEEKEVCEFNKDKYMKDGHKSYCKSCQKKQRSLTYYLTDEIKERHRERQKKYYYNNIDKTRERRRNYQNNRFKNDPEFRLSRNIRSRLYEFLKFRKIIKRNTTEEIVGCTKEFLKEHIEKQFTEGMTWDLIGKHIHIDHIIPLSSAKTEEEIYQLCHYTNLQPLWAEDNLKKSNKIL